MYPATPVVVTGPPQAPIQSIVPPDLIVSTDSGFRAGRGRTPSSNPATTSTVPAQTDVPGTGEPSSTPTTAAATGATPVSSPASAVPSRPTAEYQRTNAIAVRTTARYAIASRCGTRSASAAVGPSVTAASTTSWAV